LSDTTRLNELDPLNKSKIISELNKISEKIKSVVNIPAVREEIQKEVSERVITGYKFPNNRAQDAYLSALLSMNNPTEYEAAVLKRQFQVPIYDSAIKTPREIIRIATAIPFNENLFTIQPKWKDVVEFYGGYSMLPEKNINKSDFDLGEYDADVNLERIKLLNKTECLAIVNIAGALDVNKIPKNEYRYKGTYNISDFSMYDIYKDNLSITFTFPEKKYLSSRRVFSENIEKVMNNNELEKIRKYKIAIDQLFDDIVSDSVYEQSSYIWNFVTIQYEVKIAVEEQKERARFLLNEGGRDEVYEERSTGYIGFKRVLREKPTRPSNSSNSILIRDPWCYPDCSEPKAAFTFDEFGWFTFATTMTLNINEIAFNGMSIWGSWKDLGNGTIQINDNYNASDRDNLPDWKFSESGIGTQTLRILSNLNIHGKQSIAQSDIDEVVNVLRWEDRDFLRPKICSSLYNYDGGNIETLGGINRVIQNCEECLSCEGWTLLISEEEASGCGELNMKQAAIAEASLLGNVLVVEPTPESDQYYVLYMEGGMETTSGWLGGKCFEGWFMVKCENGVFQVTLIKKRASRC